MIWEGRSPAIRIGVMMWFAILRGELAHFSISGKDTQTQGPDFQTLIRCFHIEKACGYKLEVSGTIDMCLLHSRPDFSCQ